MGRVKEIREEAEKLELIDLPVTVLYGQPTHIYGVAQTVLGPAYSMRTDRASLKYARKFYPNLRRGHFLLDTELAISIYLQVNLLLKRCDFLKKLKYNIETPAFIQEFGFRGRTKSSNFLAPFSRIYIEHVRKLKGITGINIKNNVCQISIYTDNNQHNIGIAKEIKNLYEGIDYLDWDKIEAVFEVNVEECIATWKKLLY